MNRRMPGFTMIEILVVVTVLVILLGLSLGSFPRQDLRRQSVRLAAEELAATCRQARALAMGRNTTIAVVFHIENDPASSGRVLNNRTGGHWYRLLGPRSNTVDSNLYHDSSSSDPTTIDNLPPVSGRIIGAVLTHAPFTLFQSAEGNGLAWQGPVHVLPAGKARFLALSDMDYGDFSCSGPSGKKTWRTASATPSYPRPWFGWFDAANGRLYPWGGYDPAIPMSGFCYAGLPGATAYAVVDPVPATCVNTVGRVLDHWNDGQQSQGSSGGASAEAPAIPASDPTNRDILYAANSPRPLINGTWRDLSLVFTNHGEVKWGGSLPGRHCTKFRNDSPALASGVNRGAAERCNGQFDPLGRINEHVQSETGNFDRDTGGWYITLAPDEPTDRDRFTSAKDALDALMPIYRVFVSVLGEVRVCPVSRTPKTAGLTPWPIAASDWAGQITTRFPADRYVDGSGTAVGVPISEFITPEILANRSVWLK